MWSSPPVLLASLVTAVSALVLPDIAPEVHSSAIDQPRDILGLLGGDFDTSSLSNQLSTRPVVPVSKGFTRTTTSPPAEPTPPSPQTSTDQSTAAVTATAKPGDRTTYPHSSIETSTPSQSPILPVSATAQTFDHSSKTWQIVGIVFISILLIATFITCAMFFDRMWTFFKDVFCGKTRSEASEEFVPDSECHSWDISTSSLADLTTQTKGEQPAENLPVNTRELPWNSDSQTWNTLHRQPSRRKDHHPTA